jgi:hypothetical protein
VYIYYFLLFFNLLSHVPSVDKYLAKTCVALFVWLISHQSAVLFSQSKPAISNQPAVLFSQNKPAPAISHQPNELSCLSCVAV